MRSFIKLIETFAFSLEKKKKGKYPSIRVDAMWLDVSHYIDPFNRQNDHRINQEFHFILQVKEEKIIFQETHVL